MTIESCTFADELRNAVKEGKKTHYEELLLSAASLLENKDTRATPSADPLAGLQRYWLSVRDRGTYSEAEMLVDNHNGEYVLHSEAAKVIEKHKNLPMKSPILLLQYTQKRRLPSLGRRCIKEQKPEVTTGRPSMINLKPNSRRSRRRVLITTNATAATA